MSNPSDGKYWICKECGEVRYITGLITQPHCTICEANMSEAAVLPKQKLAALKQREAQLQNRLDKATVLIKKSIDAIVDIPFFINYVCVEHKFVCQEKRNCPSCNKEMTPEWYVSKNELDKSKQREAALVAENNELRLKASRLEQRNNYLEQEISQILSE